MGIGGRLGGVNQAGINFYNTIIDNLLLRGIQPFVTIFHNEYPQELEEQIGGWLSPVMQEEFVHFAETCFKHFADRVKYWMTINEPNLYAEMAYERATFPPARCSPPFGHCAGGNSDVEPLIAVHNLLLAHAKAAKLYREQYKSKVNGVISITVCAFMYTPLRDVEDDREAANRALAFNVAWALDPLVFGDYPPEMRRYHGSELPSFSPGERELLRDSIDFIGINHYGTLYAKDCIHSSCICNDSCCSQGSDRPIRGFVYTTGERNGVTIGERERADVRGYFIWSLMDNFEWSSGYDTRFGIYRTDPQTLNRIPKLSATWYKDFLSNSSHGGVDLSSRVSYESKDVTMIQSE
ncbi:UNVERIFIED_CONTAM: Beta-glucosidase 18 [Sesamum radiatum]|uniref:Beta-glucosidase 18 n=1 Tax=Sesamum radiatum TaxID=300843 RepID=A0AAW2K2X0_SESRA